MPACSPRSIVLTLLLLAMAATARAASNAQLIATPLVASSVGRWHLSGPADVPHRLADQLRLGQIQPRPAQRPKLLVPLYFSFAGLQALDVHSTMRALDRGYVEANPLVAPSTRNRATLVLMKAAVTASVIVGSERLWRHNRIAAIAAIVAVNGAYAAIVSHNYRNATR